MKHKEVISTITVGVLLTGLTLHQGNRLDRRIDLFDTKITTQIKELDDRLTSQIKELDDRLSSRIEELDDRLSSRIEELDDRLSSRIEELDDRLSGRIERLEQGLAAHDGVHAAIFERMNSLDNRMSRIEGLIEGWLSANSLVASTVIPEPNVQTE